MREDKDNVEVVDENNKNKNKDKKKSSMMQRMLGGGIIGILLIWIVPIVGIIVVIGLILYWLGKRGQKKGL